MAASFTACAARTSRWASPSSCTKSIVAPKAWAPLFASFSRWSGVPEVPASPWEQTTKCARCPARVALAMTPPQANSISSGWAPKAKSGPIVSDFDIGLLAIRDRVALDICDFRSFVGVQIKLFARAGHIVRAVDHRLHPAQPSVASRADLFGREVHFGKCDVRIAAFVKFQHSIIVSGSNDFAFIRHIDEEIGNSARGTAETRRAGPSDTDAVQKAHSAVHFKTKISNRFRSRLSKVSGQRRIDVLIQERDYLRLPVGGD